MLKIIRRDKRRRDENDEIDDWLKEVVKRARDTTLTSGKCTTILRNGCTTIMCIEVLK